MKMIWHDLRFGLRQLRRSPGFAAVAVLSLALGIGVNTAIFSMINGILYKSLPVRSAHELRIINWTGRKQPRLRNGHWHRYQGNIVRNKPHKRYGGSFPYPAYRDFAEQAKGFSDIFAFSNGEHRLTISAGDAASSANALMVSGNFFKDYGERVLIGRPITPEDDRRDAVPVTVITYGLWKRAFGLDPHVLGRTLTLKNTALAVIGVLPRDYVGPLAGERRIDFYVPMMAQPQLLPHEKWLDSYDVWWVQMMGRLAPGADEAQVQTSLELLFSNVLSRSEVEFVDRPGIWLQKGWRGVLGNRRRIAEPLWILQAVVGLVLLIACTNLAGLLLARSVARQHEMAVRAAMGAGRWRLIRQSLTESMILSVAGVCIGLMLSVWIRPALTGFIIDPSSNKRFNLQVDVNVLMFTLAIGVVTALLPGLFPALRAGNTDPSAGLKESGSRSAPRLRLGKILVTAQVGLSVILVVAAGLLCRTLISLYRTNRGFDTKNILLVDIQLTHSLSEVKNYRQYHPSMRQKIAAIPGVKSVALSNWTLLGGARREPEISIPGRPDIEQSEVQELVVSSEYFTTMGINLLQGRDFDVSDARESPRVVIVNEELRRLFFADKNPVGQFITAWDKPHQIVGLCSDHTYGRIRRGILPILYIPHSQGDKEFNMTYAIRTVLPPMSLIPAVRKAVAEIDKNLPLEGITTQELAIKESIAEEHLFALLSGSLSLLALVLSCIGLYGIMAYNVARRTVEMGIRKALGARSWDVAWPILSQALTLAAIGVAIGLPVALALVRVILGIFYGIEPHDPLTVIGTVLVMLTVAALAAWIPARRAAKIDPMEALRYE
jgi:predicted permease